jgi:glycosyltransferase involved in cell wall biosynthesis
MEWFFASLVNQIKDHPIYPDIKIVIADSYKNDPEVKEERRKLRHETWLKTGDTSEAWLMTNGVEIVRTCPKPCVWQGEHRLTKYDWFDASNGRNTALCLAPDGYICYVDDLSVLMPGWLKAVREAMEGGYIVCGAYRKVKDLVVENGEVKSFTPFPGGMDTRIGEEGKAIPCTGDWLYGCSVAMPVEALLTINGWPEDLCASLGSEDYCCGIALSNNGYSFKYDTRMLTLESEELHHIDIPFRKEDWHFENGVAVVGGNGKDDKSHAALNIARQSKNFPNHFNIRELRASILAGNLFPIDPNPQHEWFTKKHLSEL